MRSLVYFVACTADGYIAARDGATDFFPPFEGPQAVDVLAEFPEMMPGHLRGALDITAANQRFDTIVMGRATYEVGLGDGITSPYPHLQQIVASTTMSSPDADVEVVGEDVRERVRELKQQPGKDIWMAGGGRLAAALADELDELILKVNPVVVGSGIALFAEPVGPRPVVMTEHRVYPSGYAVLRYRWSPQTRS
jgi:dihydrofolate reductase